MLSAELEPSKTMKSPHVSCFALLEKLYLVAATVQEQSHIMLVWTSAMRVSPLRDHVCSVL